MHTVERAIEIVRRAEVGVRAIIEETVAAQRYSELPGLARIADALVKIAGANEASAQPSQSERADDPKPAVMPKVHDPGTGELRSATRKPAKKSKYPRFERDGDRLVKVGWSKKAKAEYEHRAPREAVVAFVNHLTSRVEPGEVFAVDDLLPVPDGSGELPSYQVYLTLAWLRAAEAIDKKGRDGYVLTAAPLDGSALNVLWRQLPMRT